jgi:tetratricopeptide (TPR) repeat protein
MMVAPALALVAMLAVGGSLSEAQQQFAEGRYEEAERLALQAAQPPQLGTALYLVGLARFRAGKPAEALEALEAAGQAEDAPERASWSFNRAACLYALGRFDEAEQDFLEAAEDASLSRMAWANAGFAALDGGSAERAAQWAERARQGASERELALVEELLAAIAKTQGVPVDEGDEAYRQGLASFDADRFDEARAHFLRAAKLTPSSGRAQLMAGASAYRAGDRSTAREDVTASLRLPLDAQDQETARDYLDRLSFGLRSSGRGRGLSLGASTGYDSNVLQVGVAQRDVFMGTETGSPFVEVGLGLVSRHRLSDTLFAELAYGGSQRVYGLASSRDYSLQLHRLGASLELEPVQRLRLGASAGGDVFLTGLSDFRGLQASANASVWTALDESEVTSTRLDVTLARKAGLISEFSYLTGRRLDATLSQEFRLETVAATAWYRYRRDRIGTLVQATSGQAPGVSQEYVIPFSSTSHTLGASARLELGDWGEASLSAGVEWRDYLSQSYLRLQAVDGTVEERNRRRRRDVRFVLGPSVSARLTKRLLLSLRYDFLSSDSNMDTRLADEPGTCVAPEYSCHSYDYTNGNYQKHVPMLELSATW